MVVAKGGSPERFLALHFSAACGSRTAQEDGLVRNTFLNTNQELTDALRLSFGYSL